MTCMTNLTCMTSFEIQRHRMVDQQLAARGVRDPATLDAMRTVPRELFVPTHLTAHAYDDAALPIEHGQTISQPFIVAVMVESLELQPGDRVLEIGTGSGYAAAVLSRIVREVRTVERLDDMADQARMRLRHLGFDNVFVHCGDGTLGLPEHAPFDAILVSAGGPQVPSSLLPQLATGGRLVIPVGPDPRSQEMLRIRQLRHGQFDRRSLGRVHFVPLIGAEGWCDQSFRPSE